VRTQIFLLTYLSASAVAFPGVRLRLLIFVVLVDDQRARGETDNGRYIGR